MSRVQTSREEAREESREPMHTLHSQDCTRALQRGTWKEPGWEGRAAPIGGCGHISTARYLNTHMRTLQRGEAGEPWEDAPALVWMAVGTHLSQLISDTGDAAVQ